MTKTSKDIMVSAGTSSTYTNVSRRVVTQLENGNVVVTWEGKSSLYGDGKFGVYGRIFKVNGTAIGDSFLINKANSSAQRGAAIAPLKNGGFVVTWHSHGQDGSLWGIYAQRFDGKGDREGDEFKVNSYTDSHQAHPAVTTLNEGSFVITWNSDGQDGSLNGIYAQRFSDQGEEGGEFRVNTRTHDGQEIAAITSLKDGGFVITWRSHDQDGSSWGVYAQRYDREGNKQGTEFQVNTYIHGEQRDPSIATLNDGSFVITWHSHGQDGSSWGIYAQKFDSQGTKEGDEFRVNAYTHGSQIWPSIAALKDGGFVITWQSYEQDGSLYGIYAQKFDSQGTKEGDEFRVNNYTPGTQHLASIAALKNGGFVVVYDSDHHDYIYMKLYNKDMRDVCTGEILSNGFSIAADNKGNGIACAAKTHVSGAEKLGIRCDISQNDSVNKYQGSEGSTYDVAKSIWVTNEDDCNRPFVTDYNEKWLLLWDNQSGSDNNIKAVVFDKDGDLQDMLKFNVNEAGVNNNVINYGAVAAVREGDPTSVAVAYTKGDVSSGTSYVNFRIIKDSGNTKSDEIKVSDGKDLAFLHEEYPAIAYLQNHIVIVWGDKGTKTIHGKIYNNDLTQVSKNFIVSKIQKEQYKPTIVGLGNKVLVAFEILDKTEEGDKKHIYAQIVDLDGNLINKSYLLSSSSMATEVFLTGGTEKGYVVATWLEELDGGYSIKAQRIKSNGDTEGNKLTIKSYVPGSVSPMKADGVMVAKTAILSNGRTQTVLSNNDAYCNIPNEEGIILINKVFDRDSVDIKANLLNIELPPVNSGYISLDQKHQKDTFIIQNKGDMSLIKNTNNLLEGCKNIDTNLEISMNTKLPYGVKMFVDSKIVKGVLDKALKCDNLPQLKEIVWHEEEVRKFDIHYTQYVFANQEYVHVPLKSCVKYTIEKIQSKLYNITAQGDVKFTPQNEDEDDQFRVSQDLVMSSLKNLNIKSTVSKNQEVIGQIEIGIKFDAYTINLEKEYIPYCGIDQDQYNYIQYNIGKNGFASKTGHADGALSIGVNEKWCNMYGLFQGDFNNDGRADLFCHLDDGSSKIMLGGGNNQFTNGTISFAGKETWCLKGAGDIYIADFNNDGKSDILCHNFYSSSIMLSAGDEFKSLSKDFAFFNAAFCLEGESLLIGSFSEKNATSKKIQNKDIFCKGRDQGANILISDIQDEYNEEILTTLKIVDSEGYQSIHTWCIADNERLLSGDFNGDGYTDLLCNTYFGNYIMFGHFFKGSDGSDSYHFKPAGTRESRDTKGFIKIGNGEANWCNPSNKMAIADFNKDGKDDLYCNQNGRNKFMLSQQSDVDIKNDYIIFQSINKVNSEGELPINNQRIWCESENVVLADFDGDGLVDLLCSGNQQDNITNI